MCVCPHVCVYMCTCYSTSMEDRGQLVGSVLSRHVSMGNGIQIIRLDSKRLYPLTPGSFWPCVFIFET